MLEIPESAVIAKQLKETVGGRRIVHVEAARKKHGFAFYRGEPSSYPAMLVGKTLDDAYPLAGWVEMRLGDMRLTFNDGVRVRHLDKDVPRPDAHQMLIEWDDGGATMCTVQMYGGLSAFREGENDNPYYMAAKNAISPLADAFDAHFARLVGEAKQSLSVKALLATEQRIPGLGNGCLQDILFLARVHPQSKVSALSDAEKEALRKSIRGTLCKMIEQGGRDTEKDIFGKSGGYATILSGKALDKPCPACGGTVIRKAYMGGNIYVCPRCQPLKGV